MGWFSRKGKNGQARLKEQRPKTPYKESIGFIQAAKAFEKSENDNIRKREKLAWFVAGAAGLTAVASAFAVTAMQPLVRVEPYIMLVDMNTGKTNVITTLEHKTLSNNKELNKHFLGRYVINREGYDWYTVQTTYDTVMAMSGTQEQARFTKPFHDGVGPDSVLADKYRVKVDIKSVSFVGDTAQVRFTKTTLPVVPASGEAPAAQHLIATIAYHYDNPPLKEEEREYNPTGFVVDSYQVEVENAP
ncbi:virB8 family protein [Neisseria musculi]|uniref:VirB8 family protein n=1 Tax=Neisseria musculi TaxID=1815583 RepID=A0A7H1MDA7_9NEIS|nr:type IV secretion system protein [Neisseria musculi]QNT59622.1 virB8 family protein [Neisseria musculi]